MAKAKVTLHLAKFDDIEAQVQMVIDIRTQESGRKLTDEEIAEVRQILGAPAKPPAKKRRKPKPKLKAVKTRKR
jgi:hypothetical protein